ncbi:DNA repair exonuclease [Wukongibacter baidiensis]|uniref:metallophosphoesterase family protein n=1 Tax=Wukongibacter baidiensis TaxID=1723361 RepID=UPI003D7F94AC
MLKFLHIGDVHLDTSFYSKSEELRKKLREGIRRAFSRAIDICIDEGATALLIAGDLFDNDKLSFRTEQFLVNEFNRLKEKNIKVFYATGNHDPGHISYRANSIKWPDNVYLFKEDRARILDMTSHDTGIPYRIISCGHKTNNEGRNLIKDFPVKDSNVIHVGLVHAMVTNAKDVSKHDRYLPCTTDDMEMKCYDYWALGHIHKRQRVSDKSHIYYPGNIQGRHPRETEKKGGLMVTIDENYNTNVEFKNLSTIEWHTLNVNGLAEIKEYMELKGYIAGLIREYIEENSLSSRDLILRIELEGRAYLKNELSSKENIDEMAEELILDLDLLDLEIKADNLLASIDISDYVDGNHVLSKVLELLKDVEGNEELLDRLMKTPLSRKGIRRNDERLSYIGQLLNGSEEEVLNYMVGDVDANN